MSVKEKISYFWNVILGPDIQDEDNIKDEELDEAFDATEAKIDSLENKYFGSSSKAGKGGKSSKVVETVEIDPKLVKELAKKASAKKTKAKGDSELTK